MSGTVFVVLSPAVRMKVKTLVLEDGERFAVLMGANGQPLFWPMVYSISELRGRNLAFATVSNALRALMVLQHFLERNDIDLGERLREGRLLSVAEVDSLARFCNSPMDQISGVRFDRGERTAESAHSASGTMRAYRRKLAQLSTQSSGNRLHAIKEFLDWMVRARSSGLDKQVRTVLREATQETIKGISARCRTRYHQNVENLREGLEEAVVERLLQAVDPESPSNPWINEHVRHRNALVIRWMVFLGLRRGEILSVKVSDIDFQKGAVHIPRRPDDPRDPRRYKPNVKTLARILPLSPGLLDETRRYVLEHRCRAPRSRKNEFLFVSERGDPLSTPALDKVFDVLRRNVADLPRNLTPHVLRHTWNDEYSREMDRQHVSEEIERKTRAYLMGWTPTSEMPVVYTRRHIRARANAASLTLQRGLIHGARADE